MLFFGKGSASEKLTSEDIRNGLYNTLDRIGKRKRIIVIPPDFTRFHSQAGHLTEYIWKYYGDHLTDILPAIGTHFPMTDIEINSMFGRIPKKLFRVHDWRKGISTLGIVPRNYVNLVSQGIVDYDIPIQINKLLNERKHDLIISIGQVVPHEVVGMANYNKNIFVGTGGWDGINKTHFLGAAYGMERIMGRVDTPVRQVLNYGTDNYTHDLPIIYILTVVGKEERGKLVVRGLFIGDDIECFNTDAQLSFEVNIEMINEPLKKVIVYLDPSEYKSTWIGDKSIYRTRMAIADEGELIILAPGLKQFGEDANIDKLIRKYGYVGRDKILDLVKNNTDLQQTLSAAAHLIHGSSEDKFKVTYCPGGISKEEIESVNYIYAGLNLMLERYNPKTLSDGFNKTSDGEDIFFISNPALGLWAYKDRFNDIKKN